MGLQRTLLSALGYPNAQAFDAANEPSFRCLVTWLENVKIRHYPIEQRKALGDIDSPEWPEAFTQYVQDLECPFQLTDSNRRAVLEWMLAFAISLEYADNADKFAATASKLAKQQPPQAGQQAILDLQSLDVQQHLAELFRLLHVDTHSGTLVQRLEAAKNILRDSVLPSLTDASVQQAAGSRGMQDFPLGFETGDAKLDQLAIVLRILYIKDLRDLQTLIDRLVVEVQEYTANPRTDANLGRVGH